MGERVEASNLNRRSSSWLEVVAICSLFALYAGSPPPDVNEAHYLSKAKHFWNPDWCSGDLFLNSSNAHLAFCWTFGWLTHWVSLPTAAWLGRITFWVALAVGWRRLSYSMVPRTGVAVFTAAIWLLGLHYCHMMGEWVVGTLEGKSIAYVFVLFGLSALVRNRWNTTWMCFGAAAMFHVLVGGWCVVAAALTWIFQPHDRASLKSMIPGLFAGFALSLPGLFPALQLSHGVPEEVVRQAEVIYVFRRLPHHLVIHSRNWLFIARFVLLVICWAALLGPTKYLPAMKRLNFFITGALLIALMGLAVEITTLGQPEQAAHWLRFYWFRLTDAVVPAGVALAWAVWLANISSGKTAKRLSYIVVGAATCGLIASWPTYWSTQLPRASLHQWGNGGHHHWAAVDRHAEWIRLCRWVHSNTPEDAHFLTPHNQQTFKWYAERAEAATWKDIPQDAKSTVAWWNRIIDIYGSQVSSTMDTGPGLKWMSLTDMSAQRLISLAHKYQCQYIVFDCHTRLPELPSKFMVYPEKDPLQAQASFRIYAIPSPATESSSDAES